MSSGNVAADDLRALIATVESLQASERGLKTRIAVLEQQLVTKEAEIDSLRVLPNENRLIRDENAHLREKIRDLEQTASRAVELGSLGAESQTQLSVKLQAFQRHNHYLQGEIAGKESKIRALQERVDIVTEELHQKERRCGLLVEKLRQHALDPEVATGVQIQVPEELFAQMKQKLAAQTSSVEVLQERVETLQEDTQRRELLVEALQRENAALRQSVSRLIAQINGTTQSAASAALSIGSPDADSKLRAYRSAKQQQLVA